MNNKKTPKTPELTDADKGKDPILLSVMKDFDAARAYVKNNYQDTWNDSFKEYNSIRTRREYSGVADDFIPETFSITESLKAAIAGSKPKFKFVPMNEEQEQDTTILSNLVDYYWELNNMTKKVLDWVGDMIIYGNGVLMVSWDIDHPNISNIPLADFFVDPTATNINKPGDRGYAKYAGYRYLTSIDELKSKMMFDVKTGEMVSMYSNLDDIVEGLPEDPDDKTVKEEYMGSTLGRDAVKNQVEIIEYYTQKKKIIIANRSVIIYNDINPFHRDKSEKQDVAIIDGNPQPYTKTIDEIPGFLPFAILRNYTDSSLFYARGDVQIITPIQEALNDTSSQKRDNLSYVLNNMWQIDPRFKHLAEQIESMPGAVFPIPKGALTPIEKDDISPSADSEINRLQVAMESATAANAAVQGMAQQFSRTSATEISSQLNQASARFTTKIQNLESEGFAQLARILYKCIQIFVTKPMAVRIEGKSAISWEDFDPSKFIGDYQPRVTLEATAKAEAQQQAQAIQVIAQYGLNNPLVNQEALLKKMFTYLLPDSPKDDIDELLTPPTPPVVGGDGQAIDPALTQSPNTQMTPGGANAIMNGSASSFGGTARGKMTQTGNQGGGGSGSATGNNPRGRASQPSTTMTNKITPRG